MLASTSKGGVFELPIFVCVLFVGVLLRNLLTLLNWHEVSDRESPARQRQPVALPRHGADEPETCGIWQAWPAHLHPAGRFRPWPWRSTPSSSPSGSWAQL